MWLRDQWDSLAAGSRDQRETGRGSSARQVPVGAYASAQHKHSHHITSAQSFHLISVLLSIYDIVTDNQQFNLTLTNRILHKHPFSSLGDNQEHVT